jgi:predicted nucleotide-binding protein (sugar kinase/HSP70/actin superfamily)
LFDTFVSAEEFDAYLKVTDLIWPMVHPNTQSADEYFKNQISGAMNVSFAYKIPMLIHQEYGIQWEDFSNSITYNFENFAQKVQEGYEHKEDIQRALRENEKFDPLYQEKKYLEFIFDN